MFDFDYEKLLYVTVIAMIVDIFSVPFVQKTKGIFKTSRFIPLYAFLVNLGISLVICYLFTNIPLIYSLWAGLTSWLGATSIYQALEGKLLSYSDIVKKQTIEVPKENEIVFEEGEQDVS